MKLKPIQTAEIGQVAGWLADPKNYQWLDFGNGSQILSPVSLKIMTQRDIHLLRLFTADGTEKPIGIVGLSNISPVFKTASVWAVLGEKAYAGQGYARRAMSKILTLAFTELGLGAVHAWVAEPNTSSLRLAERAGLRPMGRQRQSHYLNGRACDRLLFDILASEHKES